jgi:plastocyanin
MARGKSYGSFLTLARKLVEAGQVRKHVMGHRERVAVAALAALAVVIAGLFHVAGAAAANTTVIDIKDLAYSPPTLQVTQGDTVTWTNSEEIMPHDVTSGVAGQLNIGEMFGSEILAPGQSFAVTFAEPGEFVYLCKLHPAMTGVVIVSPS